MADTLESLEIEVKHSASGAADEITKVAQAISGLGRALSAPLIKKLTGLADAMKQIGEAGSPINLNHYTGNTFQKITQSASKAVKAAENSPLSEELQEQISQAGKLEIAVHKAAKAGKDMQSAFEKGNENAAWSAREREINATEKAAREIEKATPKPKVETPVELPTALPQSMQDLISSASQIDLLQAKLVSLRAAMQEAFEAGNADKAMSLRGQILQTEAALDKARAAAEKAGKANQEASKGIKEMRKEAAKSKGPLDNFVNSLKRIAFYRFIRTIIKAITQAFQEGLQNAYAFSQGIMSEGHRFSEALDSMSSAGLKMKNQLGSAFIGLLAAIAPIVNAIISLITRIADALSQLFAIFTGGTYLKAVDVPQKWADAAGGAAKAAKEWKNQLLGFDEINRLEESSNSGGGGGGGIDPMSMFEDAEIDGVFKRIKEKFDEFKKSLNLDPLKESFEKLKTAISGALSRIGDAISRIWEKALAPFIKWVIEELLPTNLDTITVIIEIANAIYDVLSPAIDFIWDNVLSPLARWLGNSFISSLKRINEILHEFARLINGEISFADFINNLFGIEKMINNLKAVWKKFREAVSNAWAAITEKAPGAQRAMIEFAVAIVSRFNAVVSVLQTVFGWIRNIISIAQNAIAWLGGVISLSGHMQGTTISGQYGGSHSSGKFADGGFPESGQLFIAREDGAGAELVGAIGGRTAVASNDDILNGIRQGVFEAVSAAMSGGQNDVNVKVYLDSREIKAGQRRLAYATGV